MENRERDKMSRNTESTSAGDVNRKTSSQIGKDKSDSSADFGQNIGRPEELNEPNSRSSGSGSMGSEPGNNDRNSNSDWSGGKRH